MRNTKIVATLGPATDQPAVLRGLFDAGVDVFRLNASHGTQEEFGRRIQAVRQCSQELGRHVSILLDLQGPKIRLGLFEEGKVELQTGQTFTITTEQGVTGNAERASTTYTEFARDVKPGDRVLLNDGAVELRVIANDDTAARCTVVAGGMIGDRKGINLPGVAVSTPSLTKKDVADLRFGLEAGVDMVALSFVRRRDDILRLRVHLEDHDSRVPVIAKIEKPEGVSNLDSILEEADGVMVARGDLGVEMPLEQVPFIQKQIIESAREHGKFVITATQMLESMIDHSVPTRAEVSDIANAIYDGTDAVMLSAETSAGKFPVEAASMMARIAADADKVTKPLSSRDLPQRANPGFAETIADAVFRVTRTLPMEAIVVFSSTGRSARQIARYRPQVPIFACTPSEAVARQLSVIYGVRPLVTPRLSSTDDMLRQVDQHLAKTGLLKEKDQIVVISGAPMGRAGSTNLMKLHRVGETD